MRALVPFALLPVVLLGPTSTAPAVAGAVGAHAVAPVGTSATIPSDGPDAGGVVSVTVPAGTLSLSAGGPQTGPEGCAVEVVVTDTRPGNGGFTLQATGDDVRLTAAQVPGNVMDPADLVVHAGQHGASAAYSAGIVLGSVRVVVRAPGACPALTLL